MATLEEELTTSFQTIAADIKTILATRGTMASLNTTEKGSLVAAINEVLAAVGSGGTSEIDDGAATSSTTKTYSASKLVALIATAKSEILGGASGAYDTLLEIQNAIGTDGTAISGLLTAVGKRVAVDAAQTFTTPEKLQACQNLGIGDPAHNFTADYTTARDS